MTRVRSTREIALVCLLDTNVVIGLLRGQASSVSLVQAENCDLGEMAISQISRLELLGYPKLPEQEKQTIEQFLAAIQILPIDADVEAQTIALCRSRKIKLPDAIIAATALAHGLKLLSLDESLNRTFAALSPSA